MASVIKPDEAIELFSGLRLVANFNLASFTIVVLEWAMNFTSEVTLVWQAPWNLLKVLYLLARYLPFVDMLLLMLETVTGSLSSGTQCQRVFLAETWIYVTGVTLVELIFTIRTWVVWGKTRQSTLICFTSFSGMVAGLLVMQVLYVKSTQALPSPWPKITRCILNETSTPNLVGFAALMVINALFLVLMLGRALSIIRSGEDTHLMRVVYRDGIIHYFYVFAISLANVVITVRASIANGLLLVMMARAIHAVLGCRVVLHIREQIQQQRYKGIMQNMHYLRSNSDINWTCDELAGG